MRTVSATSRRSLLVVRRLCQNGAALLRNARQPYRNGRYLVSRATVPTDNGSVLVQLRRCRPRISPSVWNHGIANRGKIQSVVALPAIPTTESDARRLLVRSTKGKIRPKSRRQPSHRTARTRMKDTNKVKTPKLRRPVTVEQADTRGRRGTSRYPKPPFAEQHQRAPVSNQS